MNNLIPRVLRRFRLLPHINLVETMNVGGTPVQIPIVQGVGSGRESEPWMLNVLRRVLPLRRGKFLDVGVNLGQTLVKYKALVPEGEYVGFEPNPFCVAYTARLIKVNRFTSCLLLPVGISDHDDLLVLHSYSDEHDSAASIVETFRAKEVVKHTQFVPVMSYATIEKKIPLQDVGVVKIDVEGAELEVLTSMRQLLRDQRPIVCCEVLPSYSESNRERVQRQGALAAILHESAYGILRVTSEGRRFEPCTGFAIHSDLSACEYVFAPQVDLRALT